MFLAADLLQLDIAADVIDQIRHSNLKSGSCLTDGPDEFGFHGVLHEAKYMFNTAPGF